MKNNSCKKNYSQIFSSRKKVWNLFLSTEKVKHFLGMITGKTFAFCDRIPFHVPKI